MLLRLNEKHIASFIAPREVERMAPLVRSAAERLELHTGAGSDFHGWLTLPLDYDRAELDRVRDAAAKIRSDSDCLIVVGIGGSCLGARSAIELLRSPFHNALGEGPEIYFAGCNLSGPYLADILRLCEGKRVSVNVISKSGTTTEPAIAFRVLRRWMTDRFGKEEAAARIYCTTDRSRGALRALCDTEGFVRFVIPENIGGRYSVLTPVGLLPIAVAGCDIGAVLRGAAAAAEELREPALDRNGCYRYAAYRNLLLRKGKLVEVFASHEPRFAQMGEWLKQLFGESEGKDRKGIFPASVSFTSDLHSLGQFLQDGSRILFETVIDFREPAADFRLENDPGNPDALDYLGGQNLSFVSRRALEGAVLAHTEGGTPVLVLEAPEITEETYGYLVYFFEKACAVSGYLLGVNPFDQPGVEAYKNNMFALLGRPGFASLRGRLLRKLR